MLDIENQTKANGFRLVIGIDEAGRGPLAGPVVAAAVSIRDYSFENKIADSKKITPKRREKSFEEIFEKAYVGIGIINESIIDQVNVLQATYLAMNTAVRQLICQHPDYSLDDMTNFRDICLLVDGSQFRSTLPIKYQTIVQGDNKVLSIAAASIIAKVTRDRILCTYDKIFPEYGFKKHKGYGTLQHRTIIKEQGMCDIHRRSFVHV